MRIDHSMSLQPYRHVLALPQVRVTMLLMFCARLPLTVMGISLTLHVATVLGHGYGAAGLAGTATTLGNAIGAPVLGRMIDRYGLRRVVAICGIGSATFWVSVPHLPYLVLVLLALPAGMIAVPVGSLGRQVLAALVPEEHRRPAFSLDTIGVETAFILGPTAGILVITQLSSTVALTGIGICLALTAGLLYAMNPPTRSAAEAARADAEPRPPLRDWLDGRLAGALLTASGALFTLVGTELAAIAMLRENGEVAWTGVVIALMAAASIAGGLVHGAARRSLSQATLAALLAVLVLPVGLFGHSWWLLAIALVPMNLMCTPTLAAGTEKASGLAPPQVRGEAMGLYDSACRLGIALGSPVVGLAMDHSSPGWGFTAAGVGGLIIAGVGLVCRQRTVSLLPRGPRTAEADGPA
jgi:predicted MFS family arabinose efflux permease